MEASYRTVTAAPGSEYNSNLLHVACYTLNMAFYGWCQSFTCTWNGFTVFKDNMLTIRVNTEIATL